LAEASAGALPGAAEQDAGDQVAAGAAADGGALRPGRHVRRLRGQPAAAARRPRPREGQDGVRPAPGDGPGGGLQEQVGVTLGLHVFVLFP